MARRIRWFVGAIVAAFMFSGSLVTGAKPATTRPKLVVLLVVDQMRGDYVDLFHAQWTGGLARMVNQGAWFRHAAYPYLTTVTCAGHATISTGQLPDAHGIIANTWLDRESSKMIACTDDPKAEDTTFGAQAHDGDSALRLMVPSFADALRDQSDKQTRVVSFSLKARAAIMLAGHQADAIAWFDDKTGGWQTSSAYSNAESVAEFVKAHPVSEDFGKTWAPAPAERFVYNVNPKNRHTITGWTDSFPHALHGGASSTGPDAAFYTQWENSPYSGSYLIRLAESAVDGLHLGQQNTPDFLAISFSSLDLVGHAMGPYSHEVQDTLFQLDRDLGALFTHLDSIVGAGNYVVAFSADHGVAPIPEEGTERGLKGQRFSTDAVVKRVNQILDAKWGGTSHVVEMVEGDLWLHNGDYDRFKADPATLNEVIQAISAMPGVAEVFRSDELAKHPTAGSHIERAASFSYYPGRSGDLVIALKPYWIYSEPGGSGTTHGSAYDYDRHVPILFYGWGVHHTAVDAPVSPVDIAPTLADLTGIHLQRTDGHSLASLLRGTGQTGSHAATSSH